MIMDPLGAIRAMIAADLDQYESWFRERYEKEPEFGSDVSRHQWLAWRSSYCQSMRTMRRYLDRIDQLAQEQGR